MLYFRLFTLLLVWSGLDRTDRLRDRNGCCCRTLNCLVWWWWWCGDVKVMFGTFKNIKRNTSKFQSRWMNGTRNSIHSIPQNRHYQHHHHHHYEHQQQNRFNTKLQFEHEMNDWWLAWFWLALESLEHLVGIGMKKTFRLEYVNEMCVMLRRRRNKTKKR